MRRRAVVVGWLFGLDLSEVQHHGVLLGVQSQFRCFVTAKRVEDTTWPIAHFDEPRPQGEVVRDGVHIVIRQLNSYATPARRWLVRCELASGDATRFNAVTRVGDIIADIQMNFRSIRRATAVGHAVWSASPDDGWMPEQLRYAVIAAMRGLQDET